AAVWLFASSATPPASAASEGVPTLLRVESFAKDVFASISERPLRRRGSRGSYDDGYRRQTSYGFFNLGGGVFDPSSQPGTGFYGVASGGTELGDAMDLGLQLSWYHRGSRGERVFASYTDPAGNTVHQEIQTQSVNTDLVPLMGIVRVKFPMSSQFQPYVGGGAGYEWLTVNGTDSQGNDFSNDYAGFGAQVMAGVNLAASPTTALYAETVYNISTVHADFYDPFVNAVVRESLDFDGLALHGGIRVRF
ncbi:MAG TPA: outer membrane beta-barrel protein, partial [Candidatus Eisenbacteria bacterium]